MRGHLRSSYDRAHNAQRREPSCTPTRAQTSKSTTPLRQRGAEGDAFGATPVVAEGATEGVLLVVDFLLRGMSIMAAAMSRTPAMTSADKVRTLPEPDVVGSRKSAI